MPSSPSLSFSASFPSSPSSSPSFGPVDSSPPSSPNLHPLSSPPGSPRPTDPFAGGNKGVKRPRIYEKRSHHWADQIDSPDNSFDASVLPGSPSRTLHTSLPSESEFDFFSEREESEADEDEFWERTISQAIDNCDGMINLNNNLIHGGLTTIPPSIADLANLVVLRPHAPEPHSPPAHFTSKREFKRAITEPVIKPSLGFMSGTSLAKTSSFTQTSVARPQNEIHLFLANNSIKRLPAELFWVQNLTVLSLRGNLLTRIPPQISNLKNLRDLNIALNKLTYLPAEMLNMELENLSLSGNPWLRPPFSVKRTELSPRKSRVASDTRVHFSIPSLSEFCLRALLSPFNPVKPSHGKDETVLEALYALPLSGTEFYPPGLIETLHACIPSAVAKPDPQIEASPAKKPRRSISTAQDPFKAPSASVVNSASRGSSVSNAEDPEKDTLLGIGNCPSPRHRAQGRRMVFVKHAEERFTWEGIIAGVRVGESFGVPLFWRGCSKDCLDFLDSPNNNTEEASQQGENIDADWEGDTEAAITDEDEDLGAQPVEFGDGELGFD